MSVILVVGPRKLPDSGRVRVWLDSGSGSGHDITVPATDLTVAEMDDGQGTAATYTLRVRECRS